MGNHHSASHQLKPRKNVHWKSAGRPAPPGKPEIIPLPSDEEPNAITLRWRAGAHDGGAPLRGYQVECNRLGAPDWIRTSPPVVLRPELVLSGLDPPHRYQFRIAALNAVGRSDYSELSDVLTVSPNPAPHHPPVFLQHLEDATALENDKTEFRVTFTGAPPATIAWFKDDYEIFSSRRTAISTDDSCSVLVFHQTLASDEGEIRCTATNRSGHAVTRAHLKIEAAPKLRYPRQYEDGLLYEVNETVFLKTTIVGKPQPTIEWRHDGQPIAPSDRVEIANSSKFSVLKIHGAQRSDRGEYQVHARNSIGEDTAAFLVTITAPPEPPRHVRVTRQVDKSVTLDWEPPADDGGCRIGNYVVEYYRAGWNVWLKATTSRKTNVTLFDLIEGSEYRFRVKAESPYGMSAPSAESFPVRIPGRAVDMEFLAVEARIISEALSRQDGDEHVSPAPRRKRSSAPPATDPTSASVPRPQSPPSAKRPAVRSSSPYKERFERAGSSEFMLVMYPDIKKTPTKAEKRESFQLDLDSLSPPPLSFSAPELSTRCTAPFRALRNAVSSTELLHEHAMARFYKAVAMKEEQTNKRDEKLARQQNNDIPNNNNHDRSNTNERVVIEPTKMKPPEIIIKSESVEEPEYKFKERQILQDSETSLNKWQHSSFEDDYTASTVSSDGEYSDEGSLNGDLDRRSQYSNEEETYNPRNKMTHMSPQKDYFDEEASDHEVLKPLPLLDPNFIPKPILKKREVLEIKPEPTPVQKPNGKQTLEVKLKKDEKSTILKRFTKMPTQKSFPFPKILNKKEPEKALKDKLSNAEEERSVRKVEQKQDKITDEGRTIIDYYGSIVKEYGSSKKPVAPLYLNTEELKNVAEKQQCEEKYDVVSKKATKVRKTPTNKTSATSRTTITKEQPVKLLKTANNIHKSPPKAKQVMDENVKPVRNQTQTKLQEKQNKDQKKITQQVVLKTTERATIVIPIDYQELEKKAKMNVRSAIDYMVDVCLLLLAFWLYFFKDERLAVPFLILIIYRQLQETIFLNIPDWFRRHTPTWLAKKTS